MCELAIALAWLLVSEWLENVPQQICLFLVATSLSVPKAASLQGQSCIGGRGGEGEVKNLMSNFGAKK